MDLTIIANLLGSINPIVLGGIAGGTLILGGSALYIKRNKNKFIDNTDPLNQSNEFKTLKTEDLEREFGSLTVQTKILDEDESLFFEKGKRENMKKDTDSNQPSTRFVDEASVFDSFGKYDQAMEALKKSIEIEKHDKEKVRLKILLSQYTNQKGKTTLDEIIEEYPSFHTKVSFGADNTISALMSSPIPKHDLAVSKFTKELEEEFDIFSDLPILGESSVITNKKTVSTPVRDIFADLPSTQESVPVVPNLEKVEKPSTDILFFEEKKPEPLVIEKIAIPTALVSKVIIPPLAPTLVMPVTPAVPVIAVLPQAAISVVAVTKSEPVVENQFDQFSWNTSPIPVNLVEESTEEILKALQKESDIIDKVNENEAIDDMQKFWKDFGGMVSEIHADIKDQSHDSDNVIPEMQKPKGIQFAESVVETLPLNFSKEPQLTQFIQEEKTHTIVDVPLLTEVVNNEHQSVPLFNLEELTPPVVDFPTLTDVVYFEEQHFAPSFVQEELTLPVEEEVTHHNHNEVISLDDYQFAPSFHQEELTLPVEEATHHNHNEVDIIEEQHFAPSFVQEELTLPVEEATHHNHNEVDIIEEQHFAPSFVQEELTLPIEEETIKHTHNEVIALEEQHFAPSFVQEELTLPVEEEATHHNHNEVITLEEQHFSPSFVQEELDLPVVQEATHHNHNHNEYQFSPSLHLEELAHNPVEQISAHKEYQFNPSFDQEELAHIPVEQTFAHKEYQFNPSFHEEELAPVIEEATHYDHNEVITHDEQHFTPSFHEEELVPVIEEVTQHNHNEVITHNEQHFTPSIHLEELVPVIEEVTQHNHNEVITHNEQHFTPSIHLEELVPVIEEATQHNHNEVITHDEQHFTSSFYEEELVSVIEELNPPVIEKHVHEELADKKHTFIPFFAIEQSTPVIEPEVKLEPVVIKEEVKLEKPFRVWVNWIVNIQGQQVFRNHFINLKNSWGTTLAAEELFVEINSLSGKTPNNEFYPWVLVSVFPLANN